MSGCRISKVTNKATGAVISIVPPTKRSDVDDALLEALSVARDGGAEGVAVALVNKDGLRWSISRFEGNPAELVGTLQWLHLRIMGLCE